MVAVVEDKAVFVGVTEVFKSGHLDLATILTAVHVVNQLIGPTEPDEPDLVFLANTFDVGNQRIAIFGRTGLITRAVDQPGDINFVVGRLLQLLHPNPRGPDKIPPPLVVTMLFATVVFPVTKGRTSGDENVFIVRVERCGDPFRQGKRRQKEAESKKERPECHFEECG